MKNQEAWETHESYCIWDRKRPEMSENCLFLYRNIFHSMMGGVPDEHPNYDHTLTPRTKIALIAYDPADPRFELAFTYTLRFDPFFIVVGREDLVKALPLDPKNEIYDEFLSSSQLNAIGVYVHFMSGGNTGEAHDAAFF